MRQSFFGGLYGIAGKDFEKSRAVKSFWVFSRRLVVRLEIYINLSGQFPSKVIETLLHGI